MRRNTLRWLGHVERMEEGNWARGCRVLDEVGETDGEAEKVFLGGGATGSESLRIKGGVGSG